MFISMNNAGHKDIKGIEHNDLVCILSGDIINELFLFKNEISKYRLVTCYESFLYHKCYKLKIQGSRQLLVLQKK